MVSPKLSAAELVNRLFSNVRSRFSTRAGKPRRRRQRGGRYVGERLEDRLLLSAVSAQVALQSQNAVAPVITSPGSTTADTTPTITWTQSRFAARAQVFVADPATGRAVINQTGTGTSYTPNSPLAANVTYRVWVRWIDSAGNPSQWSQPRDFRVVAQPPATPTLTGPGSTTSDTTPTITWRQTANSTTQVFVADVAAGRSIINRTVSGSSYTIPSPLAQGRVYRVWIRAVNSAGQVSAWSTPHDFRIATAPPPVPTITGPSASTSDLTPTIRWNTSPSAVRSEVFVADVAAGRGILHQSTSGTSLTISSPLTAGRTYRVWVRSADAAGAISAWSQSHDFTISGAPLNPPVVTGPISGSTDTTPTITWQGSSNAVRSELFVADLAAGRAVISQTVSGTSFTPTSALAAGRTYRVWVRSIDAAGNRSNWSQSHDITIVAQPTVLQTSLTRPTLLWAPVSGNVQYDLQVYNRTTGQKVVDVSRLFLPGYQVPAHLTAGNGYQVFVRTRDQNGTVGNWSQVLEFNVTRPTTTPAPTIPVLQPSNSGTSVLRTILGQDLYTRLISPSGVIGGNGGTAFDGTINISSSFFTSLSGNPFLTGQTPQQIASRLGQLGINVNIT